MHNIPEYTIIYNNKPEYTIINHYILIHDNIPKNIIYYNIP